ncbi:unnamed protein product [Ilex paraguariensis]|uniref:Uncharacterized protein n=1 Tax=Ilex paraguariensis TaxID=185542 RepID=A0ABC8R6H9_9AQUA
MGHPEVTNTEINQCTSLPSLGTRTEELAVDLRPLDGPPCDFSLSKSDFLADAPEHDINVIAGQEIDGEGSKQDNGVKTSLDVADPPYKTASKASEAESKLQVTGGETSVPLAVDESKQETRELEIPVSEHDFPPEINSAEHETSINMVQIKEDSSQDLDVGSRGDLVKKGEGKEDMHVILVANLPAADQPEILVGDYKDHKGVKCSLPLTLGSAEEISHVEDDNKDMAYDEILSSSESNKSSVSTHTFSADMNAVEGNIKQEGGEKHIVEVPIKGGADTSESKDKGSENLGSNGLEAPADASRSERQKMQANSCAEGLQTRSFDGDEVNNSTNLNDGNNADDHEVDKIPKCETAGNESREGVKEEEHSLNTDKTLESMEKFSMSTVDQAINLVAGDDKDDHDNLVAGDDTDDHEKARIEQSDTAENGKTEAAAGVEKCAIKRETVIESSHAVLETTCLDSVPDLTIFDIDASLVNTRQNRSNLQKCPDEVPQQATKELETTNDTRVPAEHVDKVSMVAELDHRGDSETPEKNSENTFSKGPGPLPVESEIAIESSLSGEESHNADGVGGASGASSGRLQEGDGGKVSKQGVAAVYISADSSSLSDSLEGNWGSVSVLSTQSDALAVVDGEALPSTDSKAAEKSEKANVQMPKTAPEGHHSNKSSDVFEHPSFMTLVEPEGGVDLKTAASEIQTVGNAQRPKSEASQAGWFPSIANVVNESQGRKKNEEIIAKVTNWSTGNQHTPLSSLLGEHAAETKTKSPNAKQTPTVIQKDEANAKNNVPAVTTVNSILGSDRAAKREAGKEWNSPARFPTDNKKEKRKAKGKPLFPFICCYSVN